MAKKKPVVSKYGQWKYPGQETIIPNANGNITMQGVPYPVLGIDDLGYSQMMMPGMDYQFPGNSVYEIPMAKKGGTKKVKIKSLPKAQQIGKILYVASEDDPAYTAYNDSLNLYNQSMKPKLTGKKSFGQYGSYGLRGRNTTDVPLPEGYTVPGPIQPIGQRITRGYYPEYLIMTNPPKPAGKDYRKKTHDIYKEPTRPVVVDKSQANTQSQKQTPQPVAKPNYNKPNYNIKSTGDYGIDRVNQILFGPNGVYEKKQGGELPKAQTLGELKEQALQRDINRQQAKAWDPNELYGAQEEMLNYDPKTGEYKNWKGEVVRVETKPMVIGNPKGAPKKSKAQIEKEKAIKYDKQTKADPTAWLAEHPEYMLDANGNPILRSMMEQAAPEELKEADIKQAKEEFVKDLNSDPLQQSLGTASLDNPVTNAAAENYANYKVNNIDPGRASDQLFRGYAAPTTRDFYQPHNVSNTLRGAAGLGATAAGITGLSYGLAALPALGEVAYAWGAANPFISATGAALTTSPTWAPGLSMANALNAGFITHGVSQLPETYEAWNNAINNGGSYLDATGQTLLNSLDFLGVGQLKAPGILDDIVGKSIQEASAAGADPAKIFVENLGKEGIIKPEAISNFTKEQWQEAAKFLERRQFVKQLQKDRLMGEGVKPADINYFARSNDRVSKLTQNALDADATLYRGVRGNKPHSGYQEYTGREYDMMKPAWGNEISEYENMVRAGVDFENPASIAEYQATHVPMEAYGYRAGMPDMGKVDAIYAASEPSDYYGNYLFEIKLPRDYSKGNFKDWYDKYFKGQRYLYDDVWGAEEKAGRSIYNYVPPTNKEMPLRLSRSGYPVVIGRKGEKLLSVNKDFPFTDLKRLNTDPEYAKAFNEYRETVRNNYNTGWLDKIKQTESSEYLNSLQNEYSSLKEKGFENLTQDELLKALDLETKLNKAGNTSGEILDTAQSPNVPENLARQGYKSTHKELADLTNKLRKDRVEFWQSPTGKARLEAVVENTPELKAAGITVNDYIHGIENMTVENRTALNHLMRGRVILDKQKAAIKELEEMKFLEQETGMVHPDQSVMSKLEKTIADFDNELAAEMDKYNHLRVNSNYLHNAFMARKEPTIKSEPGVLNLQKVGVNKDTKFTTGVGPKYDLDEAERIINHEFGHLIQRGVVTNLDKELEGLDLLKNEATDLFSSANKKSSYFNEALDYFKSGSEGREKLPFLEEVRSDMLQKGIIKNFGDEITEGMIRQHYANYIMEGRSDKGALRIYDIMKDNPKNFSIIKSVMNKMPAAVIGTGVGYGMMNQVQELPQKKFGGNIINTLNNYKNRFKEGGDQIDESSLLLNRNRAFQDIITDDEVFEQGDFDLYLGQAQQGLPSDYDKFLAYSETAPENRRPDAAWQYGNPRQYDHYGMWDALGKPETFNQALEMNPHWQPDPYDGMYHGFSTNPSTGVWLKSHIPGESHPGDTGWMEYKDFMLSNDPEWGGKNQNLVYDPELQRMRYIERKKQGGSEKKKQAGFKVLTDANGKYVFVKT